MANQSNLNLRDQLGFDPNEWLSEVNEIIKGERTENRSYHYHYSSSTSTPAGKTYERALSTVKGKLAKPES